jgi:pimeloyl-ACP methyl ester carboxylesterase
MELWYHKAGSGALPVVILHGLFGSSDNWRTLANVISASYPVISVDLRNHGRSPHTESHTYLEMAEDLDKLLNARGLEEVILVGHSMGGKAAMTYATIQPERVHKLVVVDIAPKAYNPQHNDVIEALFSVPLSQIGNRQEAEQFLARKISDPSVIQFLMKGLYRKEDGGYGWRFNLPVLAKDYAEITSSIPDCGSYKKPTLFIKGNRSNYIEAKDAPLIQKLFPNSKIGNINAGHWVHAEAPKAFLQMLEQFLDTRFDSKF